MCSSLKIKYFQVPKVFLLLFEWDDDGIFLKVYTGAALFQSKQSSGKSFTLFGQGFKRLLVDSGLLNKPLPLSGLHKLVAYGLDSEQISLSVFEDNTN